MSLSICLARGSGLPGVERQHDAGVVIRKDETRCASPALARTGGWCEFLGEGRPGADLLATTLGLLEVGRRNFTFKSWAN